MKDEELKVGDWNLSHTRMSGGSHLVEGLLFRLFEYLRSCTPLVYENRKVLGSHGMYEITPAHYPFIPSIFLNIPYPVWEPTVGSRCTDWFNPFALAFGSINTSKDRKFQDLEHIFIPDPCTPHQGPQNTSGEHQFPVFPGIHHRYVHGKLHNV